MHTQRIEMALLLPLVLISVSCVSATAVQDSQIEIISTKPAGDQHPSVLNQEQNSTPDINSLLRVLSVQLAELKVEVKHLQRQNEEQSTTLKELEVQSELEKLQQQQYKQLQQQQQEQQQQDTLQLQNQIQTQAAELVSIKSKAYMNEEQVEALKKDREVRQVAFSASLRGSGPPGFSGPFNTRTNLIFKSVIENVGKSYNPQTGIFTAPVRGTYHFEFYIHGAGEPSYACGAMLMKNEENICYAFATQTNSNRVSSSNGATLLLEVGDVVFLRQWSNTRIYDEVYFRYTTFSGHLLFTM